MATKIVKTRLVIRNDNSTTWTTKNPILLKGELGFELDTRKFKIGDGATNWNSLPYANIQDLSVYYTKSEIIDIVVALREELLTEIKDIENNTLILPYDDLSAFLNNVSVHYDSTTNKTSIVSITSESGVVYTQDELLIGTTILLRSKGYDYWLSYKEKDGNVEAIDLFTEIDGFNLDLLNYAKIEDITCSKTIPTTATLGGIPKGTDLSGKTSKEILDMLLFPYVEFKVTMKTTESGGDIEYGTTRTVTSATVTITLGSENIASITIKNGNTELITKTDDIVAGANTITLPEAQVVTSDTTFSCVVVDTYGTSKSASATKFTFVYPYYYGAIDNGVTLTESLVKGLSTMVSGRGTKTVTITMNQQNALFAYPKSYGEIKKIFDGNNFDVTETFVKSELAMYDTTYYVYVLSQPATASMEYKFNYS